MTRGATDWATVLADPATHAVVVDWKESGEEILAQLRARHPDLPGLADDELDLVIADFAPEPGPRTHAALGQQLTSSGLRLARLPTDTDELHLVLVVDSEVSAFTEAATSAGLEPDWLTQPRRAHGEPAQRLTTPVSEHRRAAFSFDNAQYADTSVVVSERVLNLQLSARGWQLTWLDHTTWPPARSPWFEAGSPDWLPDGSAVADRAKTGRATEPLRVSVGDPDTLTWEPVRVPPGEDPSRTYPSLVGTDLLLARSGRYSGAELPGTLWSVEDVVGGNRQAAVVRGLPDSGLDQVDVLVRGGRAWIQIDHRLYAYDAGRCQDTGIALVSSEAIGSSRGFVFVDEVHGLWGELDLGTGRFRHRDSPRLGDRLGLVELGDGWVCALSQRQPTRDRDLAHLWHPESDTWRAIPFGYFGDAGITGLVRTPADDVWSFDQHSGQIIDAGPWPGFIDALPTVTDLGEERCSEYRAGARTWPDVVAV